MAGTDRTRTPVLGGPRVILVETQLAENTGAVARAMLNCGLTELALVAPREALPHPRAEAMAAGATEVLDHARTFDSVEAAVADLAIVYAATARPRELTMRVVTPRRAAAELRAADRAGERIGILFGPERSGLTNDHLALADTVISVPLNPAYSSLNLAQAVLIVAYEWFAGADGTPDEAIAMAGTRPAEKAELQGLFDRLEAELEAGGFFRARDMKAPMVRNLRAMLQRARLSEQEVRTLQGVISSLTRSWRDTQNARRRRGEID